MSRYAAVKGEAVQLSLVADRRCHRRRIGEILSKAAAREEGVYLRARPTVNTISGRFAVGSWLTLQQQDPISLQEQSLACSGKIEETKGMKLEPQIPFISAVRMGI